MLYDLRYILPMSRLDTSHRPTIMEGSTGAEVTLDVEMVAMCSINVEAARLNREHEVTISPRCRCDR